MTLKQKVLKTLFYLSFYPYIILILMATYVYYCGVSFMFGTAVGSDALVVIGALAWLFSPGLVLCLIYQLLFIVCLNKKEVYKQYNTKKFLLVNVIVLSILLSIKFTYNVCNNLYDKYGYKEKIYDNEYLVCDVYSSSYDDCLDSYQFMNNDELSVFLKKHPVLHDKFYNEFHRYSDSYLVIVSPKLEYYIWDTERPIVKFSNGFEKVKVAITYYIDEYYRTDSVIVTIFTASELKGFDVLVDWKGEK